MGLKVAHLRSKTVCLRQVWFLTATWYTYYLVTFLTRPTTYSVTHAVSTHFRSPRTWLRRSTNERTERKQQRTRERCTQAEPRDRPHFKTTTTTTTTNGKTDKHAVTRENTRRGFGAKGASGCVARRRQQRHDWAAWRKNKAPTLPLLRETRGAGDDPSEGHGGGGGGYLRTRAARPSSIPSLHIGSGGSHPSSRPLRKGSGLKRLRSRISVLNF